MKHPQQNPTHRNNGHDQNIVEEADSLGYFFCPDRNFLQQYQNSETKDLLKIYHLALPHSRMRVLGDVGLCSNLTTCIINNNYITAIDSLASCKRLQKLDVHSNQIVTLPGSEFWSQMQCLIFLHLHDNPIGDVDVVQNLGSCTNLTVLTLYDTPISLGKHYRHNAVNSIWSLKALDNFVISDEEILEGAKLGEPFSALHPVFAVDTCPAVSQEATDQNELDQMKQTLRKINFILAHYSPVHIIQRFCRGFAVRRKLVPLMAKRPSKKVGEMQSDRRVAQTGATPEPAVDSETPANSTYDIALRETIDFDTYLRTVAMQNPEDANKKMEGLYCSDHLAKIWKCSFGHQHDKKKSRIHVRRVKEWRPPERTVSYWEPTPQEPTIAHFRLQGFKQQIRLSDPTMEMILAKREAANDIRSAEDECHDRIDRMLRPVIKKEPSVKDFRRLPTIPMGLTCLFAIEDAYRDRDNMDKRAEKRALVSVMKEQRDSLKERLQWARDIRREQILDRRAADNKMMLKTLERREMLRTSRARKKQDQKRRLSLVSEGKRRDLVFVSEFGVKNNTVSQAWIGHDKKLNETDKLLKKSQFVHSRKAADEERKETVRKYMELRTQKRQSESAVLRATMDSILVQEQQNRIQEAKMRVIRQNDVSYKLPKAASSAVNYTLTGKGLTSVEHVEIGALPAGRTVKPKPVSTA